MLIASQASALTIIPDFSTLGRVYQGQDGFLSNVSGTGHVDVTAGFENVVTYLAGTLEKAIGARWSETISFALAPIGDGVAQSGVSGTDANGRPATSRIEIDTLVSAFFIDPTPADNSEFAIGSRSATLGGGDVNVSRFGNAVEGGPAEGRWDLSTVILHEMEHSVAFNAIKRYFDALPSDPGSMIIPSSLTGLPNSFALPFRDGHVDGTTDGGLFNDNVIALPGFDVGQRGLLAGSEIYGMCYVEGCTASQVNANPYATVSPVPLPGSAPLFGVGLVAVGVVKYGRRRRDSESST